MATMAAGSSSRVQCPGCRPGVHQQQQQQEQEEEAAAAASNRRHYSGGGALNSQR